MKDDIVSLLSKATRASIRAEAQAAGETFEQITDRHRREFYAREARRKASAEAFEGKPIRPRGGVRPEGAALLHQAKLDEAKISESSAVAAAEAHAEGKFRPIHPATATKSLAGRESADYPRAPYLDELALSLEMRKVRVIAEALLGATENEVGATCTGDEVGELLWDDRRKLYRAGLYKNEIGTGLRRLALEGYVCYTRPKRNGPVVWTLLQTVDLDELLLSRS